jgi:hypothetical protein
MNETTENFLKAMQEFISYQPAPIEYRLYYDETGTPIDYSIEDKPGRYIVIDQATYSLRSDRVRVVDGQLIEQKQANRMVLRPAESGRACHPDDVTLIDEHNSAKVYWKLL